MKNMDKFGLFLEFNRFKPIFKPMKKSGNSGVPAASGISGWDKIYGKKEPVVRPLKSNFFFD
jgi:hypothetical protein